jgi:hypothetical protein
MATGAGLTGLVDQLIDLFNRRSLDLPDGLFTRHTRLLLNGVAFEEMLGRSPSDPLVLMLARGPAGYRFTAKALQHAVPDAHLQRGELAETAHDGANVVVAQCWLSGRLRRSGDRIETVVEVTLRFRGETVDQAAAVMDVAALDKLREARREP